MYPITPTSSDGKVSMMVTPLPAKMVTRQTSSAAGKKNLSRKGSKVKKR